MTPQNDLIIKRDDHCREEGQVATWSHTAREQKRRWASSFPTPNSPCPIQSLAGLGSPTGACILLEAWSV